VITHDDRYFDLASRIVKFEDGQVVSDRVASTAAPLAVETH
jgi:ABC-type siderophore export system fused ATPase/permease subunit